MELLSFGWHTDQQNGTKRYKPQQVRYVRKEGEVRREEIGEEELIDEADVPLPSSGPPDGSHDPVQRPKDG